MLVETGGVGLVERRETETETQREALGSSGKGEGEEKGNQTLLRVYLCQGRPTRCEADRQVYGLYTCLYTLAGLPCPGRQLLLPNRG